jgi:MYXO-CTERM domain-containing protein
VFPGQNALCGVAGCGDGVIATAPTCNGIGNCVASSAISDCYPYACTSDGPACLTKCTTNDDCSAGARCVDEKCITPLDTDGGTPVDAGVGGPDGSVTPSAGGGTSTGTGGASGAAGNRGTGGGHAGSSNGPDAGLLADGAVPPDSGQVSGHKSGSGSGCGCRVAGNTDDDDRPLALGLVALGAVALRRARRKR